MAEVSWDEECDQTSYNPLLTLREKRVLINPRCYGKKSKTEKKAFRMEERKRWVAMLAGNQKMEEEAKDIQARQEEERRAMNRRHEREMAELTQEHESWDDEFCTSPLFYIRREQEKEPIRRGQDRETIRREHETETIRREREMERRRKQACQQDILKDNSWDTVYDTSPLDYIRQGMQNIKF